MTDWDERIPAAIAEAEKLTASGPRLLFESSPGTNLALIVTAGEVAMADALWRVTMAEGWHIDPALREFTEKIERLNYD